MKTPITAYNAQTFEQQILALGVLLGNGQKAVAEVIGYQLFESDGGFIGGNTGNPQGDLTAITQAFTKWEPAALAEGIPLEVQTKIRLLPNGANSGWLSFSEALALALPPVA